MVPATKSGQDASFSKFGGWHLFLWHLFLVADPEPVIAKLAEILPGRFTPGPAVAACVKPQLFSNRGG